MNLFDLFQNTLFQQELKQNRRQIEQQKAYDELEADIWQNDCDRDNQDESDFMDEYDCADIY